MNTDSLIINRLGELDRKKVLITSFENHAAKRMPLRHIPFYASVCAASVIILFAVGTSIFKQSHHLELSNLPLPSFEEYRGGSCSSIEEEIQNGNYPKALQLTNISIAECKKEIAELESNNKSEESEYLRNLDNVYLENLLWTRIYILTELNDKENLKSACKEYLHHTDYKQFRSSAEKLLKNL